VAGFLLTFFSSHRQIFVRVDRRNGKTRVSVAGQSSRDPAKLDRAVARAVRIYRGEAS